MQTMHSWEGKKSPLTCWGSYQAFLRTEDWDFLSMRIEDMTHLNMRKWRHNNTKLIMIEDDETCDMLFHSNYFGSCLNKLCTVIASGLWKYWKFYCQNIENSPEDKNRGFCTRSVRILTVRIVRTHLGGKTPLAHGWLKMWWSLEHK